MRHRVFGEDIESGERIEIVVEADSMADAEAKAGRRGVRATRVEVDEGAAATTPVDATDGDDGFASAPARERRDADDHESELWIGGPSQWTNFWRYLVALIVLAALLAGALLIPKQFTDKTIYWPAIFAAVAPPLVYAGYVWLRTAVVNIEVTSERLRERNGIIMRTLEEIELFRVKDMEQRQSLAQRMVGLGTLVLHTSDTTRPTMVLNSIRGHRALHDTLRRRVERLRRDRGVREFDMNETAP